MSPGFSVISAAMLIASGLSGADSRSVEVRICSSLDEAATSGSGPMLLVFFSIECPVCYEELFESRYLIDKGGWPVAVVGVSLALRDDLETFLNKYAWTSPVVLDRRKVLFRKFKVDAVPFRILLLGKEEVYRDDPYLGPEARRKRLTKCLIGLFSR